MNHRRNSVLSTFSVTLVRKTSREEQRAGCIDDVDETTFIDRVSTEDFRSIPLTLDRVSVINWFDRSPRADEWNPSDRRDETGGA